MLGLHSTSRLIAVIWASFCFTAFAETSYRVGCAKVDITPNEPVRMSGYGSRDHPSEGIDTPLNVRVMSFDTDGDDDTQSVSLLISVDNIGFAASLTDEIAARVRKKYQIPRDQIVISCTHTHSAPTLNLQLSNIFTHPLTESERAAAERYLESLQDRLLGAVDQAIADLAPAQISHGIGKATFAANRRVLSGGKWTGFGVQEDGPVDHSVPVLRITDESGKVRGIVFNYACHCTTVGGNYYQINADWAGYAATELESIYDGAVALCTIGCGADSNPNPRGTVDLSRMHGDELAKEVKRIVDDETLQTIDGDFHSTFDYAALSFDLPTREELEARLAESFPQGRRHAESLMKVYQEKGRLPATYPVPIQAWRFGDQLTMVFLGGEVVVDYAHRLRKSLADNQLWVTAYSNDVMGYIASERMRSEGGYEFDRSGVYYGLPGPWASGSEDLLVRRVTELVRGGGRQQGLSPKDSAALIHLVEPFELQLVASEPLIKDPINLAFADDGSLWVVEMGGYPETDQRGRIKRLTDDDGDGVFDHATTFLDGLNFPTGVTPYRDGILISVAPDILFARDSNGDDKADDVTKLYTGFRLANPQHRISGFTYGLDHSWHLAAGDNLGEITSLLTGETINASGHDVQIWPDTGKLVATSGRSQYIRSRDDWGHWFGNNNSRPMYHFPIDDADLRRNRSASYSSGTQSLFSPAVAPPVFPRSSSAERFNDLFAANRFTSACSSIVASAPSFDQAGIQSLFVCEPVHNLVHRSLLVSEGASFRAERTVAEQQTEFLASEDPWFRPVRVAVGPDGMLWVVDMYRAVIEHPEWIPESWQARLDLRAGEHQGRIYRIVPKSSADVHLASIESRRLPDTVEDLVECLNSPIGSRRSAAQRRLIELGPEDCADLVRRRLNETHSPHTKVHALWILHQFGELGQETLLQELGDSHPGTLTAAIQIARRGYITKDPQSFVKLLSKLALHKDLGLALQAVLALGDVRTPSAGTALAAVAKRRDLDQWLTNAIVSSASHHAEVIATTMLASFGDGTVEVDQMRFRLFQQLVQSLEANSSVIVSVASDVLKSPSLSLETRMRLATILASTASDETIELKESVSSLRKQAMRIAMDEEQDESIRCQSIRLINEDQESAQKLVALIEPATPASVQCATISAVASRRDSELNRNVLQRWSEMTSEVRTHLLAEMLSRTVSTTQLLDEIESGTIVMNEIPLAMQQQLVQSGSRSMRVRASRLISQSKSTPRNILVRQYLDGFDDAADLSAGATLFKKHCAVCHAPEDPQSAVGPNLANLSNRSADYVTVAVLDPNRAVEPKYQNYLVQTDDGRVLAGVIESEIGDSLTLAHADGKRTTVDRASIESIKNSGASIMPEGFEKLLKPVELQAIIKHVQSL